MQIEANLLSVGREIIYRIAMGKRSMNCYPIISSDFALKTDCMQSLKCENLITQKLSPKEQNPAHFYQI